ncbi:hypothetical protein FHX12_005690 [Rhizobium sp. BK609]|nr:hypothetical protein [Rhizobium sp. BK609]
MMPYEIDNGQVISALISEVPAGFVSGTRIRTPHGEIAVEKLTVGDFVMTAAGNTSAIVRIASRTIREPAREHRPVQVKARAFPGDVPQRGLQLSQSHAVCVRALDEVLIPIDRLINGATVAAVDIDEVTYWHVELASHEVLLAEGLSCESCLNRGAVSSGDTPVGDKTRVIIDQHAKPLVKDGAVIAVIRHRLHSRAESMGWAPQCGDGPAPHRRWPTHRADDRRQSGGVHLSGRRQGSHACLAHLGSG